MKTLAMVLAAAGIVLVQGTASANSDDLQWIAQCLKDNADAKVSAEVVNKYCTCMNEKMPESETLSITQWEKTHLKEQAECDRQAGWVK